MKWRESVAAIITYGVGTASSNSSVIVEVSSSKAGSSVGETGLGSLASITSRVIVSSAIALRTCSVADATVSPTRMRRLTAAVALEAITLWAGEPERVVTAIVVRTRAAGSGPAASSARFSSGCRRRALAKSGRSGAGACGAIRVNISSVGSGSVGANCRFSSRTTARAILAVGPFGAGVEE